MILTWQASLLAASLFVAMLLSLEVGRRLGLLRRRRDPEGAEKGIGAVEGAVFGLLALLVAFTFSGAASRFENRRHLIGEEANDIGTAYLRIDLLPPDAQPEMRDLFRRYLDARIEAYRQARDVRDAADAAARLARSTELHGEIWGKAVAACRMPDAPGSAAMLLLPALNAMFDITTTRGVATQNHPPMVIFAMLLGLCLLGGTLAGYGMSASKSRHVLHMIVFAAMLSLTVYVILDLEYPRVGFIRIDKADQVMVDLRASMR